MPCLDNEQVVSLERLTYADRLRFPIPPTSLAESLRVFLKKDVPNHPGSYRIMCRTIACLTALLVAYPVLTTEEVKGGHGRRSRSCCAPQPTCCAPRSTCCTPQATACCPSAVGPSGDSVSVVSICLQSTMFNFGGTPSVCMWIATCYAPGVMCGPLGTLCTWDGPCGSVASNCQSGGDPSTSCLPLVNALGTRVYSPGIPDQITYIDEADEDKKLTDPKTMSIVERRYARITILKKDKTTRTVNVRLLVIKFKNPTTNLSKHYAMGYEVKNAIIADDVPSLDVVDEDSNDGVRVVRHDLDYRVRVCMRLN